MLRVEKLKVHGLPPLSFEVRSGECVSVEGPSGSGKTRLLRALADLDPSTGRVFVDGGERSEMSAHTWRRKVRFCSAEPAWWTDTPRPAFEGRGMTAHRVERLLAAVGLPWSLLDRQVALLSTGERQRLALVRSLLDEPRVLLLDEPTSGLDPASAALVEELIRFQALSGRAVVLVSHDRHLVDRLANARLQLAPPQHGSLRPEARPSRLDA